MEKYYFLQNYRTLSIYKLDLLCFNPKSNYKAILGTFLPRVYNNHPILADKLNLTIYFLLLYCMAISTRFNQKHIDFLNLKKELFNSIPQSVVHDVHLHLIDRFKIIGKSENFFSL